MRNSLLFIFGFLCALSFAQTTTKPNILFIAMDDLKPTINSFGDSDAITPNIDRIVANGTKFLNNQCQWSVCGPTRASLLSGKRSDFTKVYDQQTQLRAANPNLVTLPQYLKQNGYTVIGGGKVFDPNTVDSGHDTVSWSSTFKKTEQMTYNATYGKPTWSYYQSATSEKGIADALVQANGVVADAENIFRPVYEIGEDANGISLPDDVYNDGATAKWAETQLDNFKTTGAPFFLAVGFKHPHLPFNAPKSYYELYDKNTLPLASFTGIGTNSAAITVRSSAELGAFVTPGMSIVQEADGRYTISEADQRTLIHAYYASVSYADAQVGKLLDKLASTGLASNTIVVLFGDHGYNLGDHKLWTKHNLLEQANNSPLVIYDPRNPSVVKTVNAPTEHIDMYPTICSLAGLTIPNNIDGKNLKPLMTGEQTSVKDFAVSQFNTQGKYGYSFRTDRYRYIVWLNNGKLSTDKPTTADYYSQELYDYVTDPNETNNYIDDVNYTSVKTDLVAKAQTFFASGGGIINGAVVSEPTNVIPVVLNGNFEHATYHTSWGLTATTATLSNTTATDAAAGNGGAKINVTTAGALNSVRLSNQVYTTTDLSGKAIRVTFKAKCGGVAEQLKVRIFHKVSGVNAFLTSNYIKPTVNYATYTADFSLPANTTDVRVDFLMGDKTGNIYIDDVVVTDESVLKKTQEPIVNVGVYPIPANHVVTIDTPELIKKVTLYDFEGKEIKNVVLKNKSIDVTNYLSGTYHLVIETSKGTVTRKIIIAH